MAVPDYQSIMLPLLKIAGDGNEHSKNEAIERLAQQFGLSENERNEILQSGQRKFDNRVSWARTYMQKALLLSSSGRSKFRLTERGMQVLKNNPHTINDRYSPTNWWERVLAAGKRSVHGRFWRYEQTNRANGCFQAILPQSGVQGKRTRGARQYRDP